MKLPGISTPYIYDYNDYGQLESITDPEDSVTWSEYYPEVSPYGCGTGTNENRDMDSDTGGYVMSRSRALELRFLQHTLKKIGF